MNDKICIEKLLELLNEVKDRLRADDFENAWCCTINGEWELGFDTLCCQLYEYDIPITKAYYNKLTIYNTLLDPNQLDISHLKDLTHIEELKEIVNEVKDTLPENDIADIFAYIDHYQYRSAFEIFCVSICENKTSISQNFYNKLLFYAKLLNEPESNITPIKKLIQQTK